MSTPIPMPAPVPYSMNAPAQASHPNSHHSLHHHSGPAIGTNDATALSPSNVSSHSSAFLPPSTAATSPTSNFVGAHGQSFAPTLPVSNPNATTKILQLSDFSKELKTRDIQLVFAEWEDDRGGFKIKWIDDTSCLIVFADPGTGTSSCLLPNPSKHYREPMFCKTDPPTFVASSSFFIPFYLYVSRALSLSPAKRAFLTILSNPPPSLTSPHSAGQRVAKLRAYNGPDVTHILASVQNRPRSRSTASQSHHSRASSMTSVNVAGPGGLGRRPSMGALAARNRASISGTSARGPPPNPIVQAQVQELIDHVTTAHTVGGAGSAARTAEGVDPTQTPASSVRARIDDAGKRFIAAGLGKPSSISGLDGQCFFLTIIWPHLTRESQCISCDLGHSS